MPSCTGVEIGPDSCVLVRARRREGAIEIGAVRIFEPADWPDDPTVQAMRLREARHDLGLPRRAVVVAWSEARFLSPGAGEATLRTAGFTVDKVLSPADALGHLAWARGPAGSDAPTAWLSINHHGAAIAVVRGADVLYSHEFTWRIQAPDQRVQAHLLRRYLYVAQLTPEIRRAMQAVEKGYGLTTGTAVVCGNVPDLRTLTMPLIRELDLEFETLDSMDGFHADERRADDVAAAAPALRLASAASAHEASGKRGGTVRWLGAAAGVLLAAGVAWWAFSLWPDQSRTIAAGPPEPAPVIAARAGEPSGTAGSSGDREAGETPGAADRPKATAPAPQPSMGISGADRPQGGASTPLGEPVPPVGGVLISTDRRLAVVDGAVVGVGDRVGAWTVVRIELDGVVLRDTSGRHVRVPVRTRSGGS